MLNGNCFINPLSIISVGESFIVLGVLRIEYCYSCGLLSAVLGYFFFLMSCNISCGSGARSSIYSWVIGWVKAR